MKPSLIFDSKFSTYANLSQLNALGIKFITLRRRGKKLIESLGSIGPWKRIYIPHTKRKYQNPQVYESMVELTGYSDGLRQIVMRGNGHQKPTLLISNDMESPVERIFGDYARRCGWRMSSPKPSSF